MWAVELPHGMPKDSNLLPNHTQELLRAARSGRLYKRPAPAEEEDADAEALLEEKKDKKEEDPSAKGFQIKIWKQIPRNAEGATISHLAKRRKATVTLSSDLPAGNIGGPTVTKATVRRLDATGNPYTREVTLHEGQSVDGEIISTTVVAVPQAAINADGASAAATPVRRRPPPPKRKPKGPGRGRKKKLLPLPLPARPEASGQDSSAATQGVKFEGPDGSITKPGDNDETKDQDTEMADDDDGDDDGDDGDEGDEGDEDEGEGSVSRAGSEIKPESVGSTPVANLPEAPIPGLGNPDSPVSKDPSPPSNPALPTFQPNLLPPSSHFEGSPLKNLVAVQSPKEEKSGSPAQDASYFPASSIAPDSEAPAVPSEPIAAPVPSVETGAATATSEPVLAQTTTTVVEPEPHIDVEMGDAPVVETSTTTIHEDLNTGNISSTTVVEETRQSTSVAAADQLQVNDVVKEENVIGEQQDVTNAPPPAIDDDTRKTDEPVPSATITAEISNDTVPAPKDSPLVDTAITEISEQQPLTESINEATIAPEPLPAPVVEPRLEDAAPSQVADENEPDSPDLFSGLEAALNLPAPKEEPVPEGEATASNEPPKEPTPPPSLGPEATASNENV
ncbi:hypothetical protein F5Y15DRAFT_230834 [Xylariaceae sp. FL0016]|nr:hypothetical protein F5Y15DRAFT_230834 [Xylariaceae sp. FL0016]